MELREKEKGRQFELDKIRFQNDNKKKELLNQLSFLKLLSKMKSNNKMMDMRKKKR